MLNPFVTGISIVVTVNIMSLQSHGHDTVYRYGMWLASKTGLLTMSCPRLTMWHSKLTTWRSNLVNTL